MRFLHQIRYLLFPEIGVRHNVPFMPCVLRVAGLVLSLFFVSFASAQTSPTFTSSPVLSGVYGATYTYNITTTDLENDVREIVTASTLPIGLVLTDNGDGTATLTGTVLETGSFPCKQMAKSVFTNDAVADYYNTNLVNAKIDMEKGEGLEIAKLYEVKCYPNLLFIDGNGSQRGMPSPFTAPM